MKLFLFLAATCFLAQNASPPTLPATHSPQSLECDPAIEKCDVIDLTQSTAGTNWNLQSGSMVMLSEVTQAHVLEIDGPTGELMVKVAFDTGKVTYGTKYTPDAAAKAFWEAIGQKYPCPAPAKQ